MSIINIHLYGKLRRLAENSGSTDESKIELSWNKDETLAHLINNRFHF